MFAGVVADGSDEGLGCDGVAGSAGDGGVVDVRRLLQRQFGMRDSDEFEIGGLSRAVLTEWESEVWEMQSGKMRKQGLNGKTACRARSGMGRAAWFRRVEVRVGVFRQPAMQTPVLVLNASYEPINICGARRALVLVLKGVARTEEEQGAMLHAARMQMAMPSVIRLLEYRRIPHQTRALSRKNILLRDRNSCQYCSVVLTAGELTLDHVVPRSRGGLSTWENLVACCHDCNRRKGNQLLHELTEMKTAAGAAAVFAAYLAAYYADDWKRGCCVAEVSVLRG